MTNNEHKVELVSLITNLMKEIYLKPLHPKNKILIYTRYILTNSHGIMKNNYTSQNVDFRKRRLHRQPIYL